MKVESVAMTARQCGWKREWHRDAGGMEAPYGFHISCVNEHAVMTELQLHRHPDNTFCIVLPDSPYQLQTVESVRLLLEQAEHIWAREKARSCRSIVPLGTSWEAAFETSAFSHVGRLNFWRCDSKMNGVDKLHQAEIAIVRFSTADLVAAIRTGAAVIGQRRDNRVGTTTDSYRVSEITSVLDHVLTNTGDLPEVSPSDSTQLLNLWALLESVVDVYVAMKNEHPVGLAVLSTSASHTPQTIEYVGVVPQHRNQGVGSQMIRQLKQDSVSAGSFVVVAANANHVASQFYMSHDFTLYNTASLWIKQRGS